MSDFLAGAGPSPPPRPRAAAILCRPGRRAAAMLVALALIPVLILGDQWNSHQIADLRDDTRPIRRPAGAGRRRGRGAGLLFRRWPLLLPLAIVAALPFRVPLARRRRHGQPLVPLYLVIAGRSGGARAAAAIWGRRARTPSAGLPARPRSLASDVPGRRRRPLRLQSLYSERLLARASRTSASSSSPSRSSSPCSRDVGGTAAAAGAAASSRPRRWSSPVRLRRVRDPRA